MSRFEASDFWYPVAVAGRLRDRPLAVRLAGKRLVLFRGRDAVSALPDRCPHRHAPLSAGCVEGGRLRCPYHGWLFDERGVCVETPGVPDTPQTGSLLTPVSAIERHGLIWVGPSPSPTPTGPYWNDAAGEPLDVFFIEDETGADISCAAENFLDGTHTHFVHPGLVRSTGSRQAVRAELRGDSRSVEARYRGEKGQEGLISRLLEPERTESRGRFVLPGIAEIEYYSRKGLELRISAYLVPIQAERLRVTAAVSTPRRLIPARLKQAVLGPLFRRVLRQDKRILELQRGNLEPTQPFLSSPADLLGPWIRVLLAGESAAAASGRGVDLRL